MENSAENNNNGPVIAQKRPTSSNDDKSNIPVKSSVLPVSG